MEITVMRHSAIGLAVMAVMCLHSASASDQAVLNPDLPYQAVRLNPVTYDVDFSAVVTPPYKGKVLKVWLPMP